MNSDSFYEENINVAMRLFEGDEKAAKLWLNQPAKALGGLCPKDVAPEVVRGLVERVEQGIVN